MTTRLLPLPAPTGHDSGAPHLQPAGPAAPGHMRRDLVLAAVASVVVALIAGAAVYFVSNSLPATFQSSNTVRVAIQGTSDVNDAVITASNDLASQYAQLASAGSVVALARKHLKGADVALKSTDIAAATVAAQNLIKITVNGDDAGQAQRRADAVGAAFVATLRGLNGRQAGQYAAHVAGKLGPIKASIAATKRQLSGGTQDSRRNAAIVLASLIVQLQQVQATVAQNEAAMQPNINQVASAGPGAQVSPKPKLYAIVGFVIVLLVVGRVLVVAASRRPLPPPAAV